MNTWELDDGSTTIAFAGDWHGVSDGVFQTLKRLSDAGITRVYHVGDFAIWPDKSGTKFLNTVNGYAEDLGIGISVTPGNHEDWAYLDSALTIVDPEPFFVRPRIAVLPRAHRWSHAGRSFVSFGGSASIDFEYRTPRRNWWPEELPTGADLEHIKAGGRADIMITHDSPIPGTPMVEQIRASNPQGWSEAALDYAAGSARMITDAWNAVQPHTLVHGHFHVRDTTTLPTGQRIYSLAAEQAVGNVMVLNLKDLSTEWLEDFGA